MDELKTCPCCGGDAKLIVYKSSYDSSKNEITTPFAVKCDKCELTSKTYITRVEVNYTGEIIIHSDGAKGTTAAWNRRTNDD